MKCLAEHLTHDTEQLGKCYLNNGALHRLT